uniref:Secreted protein n=1 Tax=Trichogramma kaykai TaxID=54128 RepID=A0ABD2XC68_9HYME
MQLVAAAAAAAAVAATRCRAPHDNDDDDDVTFERLYIMLRRAQRLYALVITEKKRERGRERSRQQGPRERMCAAAAAPIYTRAKIYLYTHSSALRPALHTVRGAHHAECAAGRCLARRESTASATRVKVQSSLSLSFLAQAIQHNANAKRGRDVLMHTRTDAAAADRV